MNISSEDKHTPIQILPNSALHLNGGNRPIGLFILGFSSVRIFCPYPVASAFVGIGGMAILLCLVAMVTKLGELYASLKALTCILQSSRIARREMGRIHGYQVRKNYWSFCKAHESIVSAVQSIFGSIGLPRWNVSGLYPALSPFIQKWTG